MKLTSGQLRKIINEELADELTESEGLSDIGHRRAVNKLQAILDMPEIDRESQIGRRLKDLYLFLIRGYDLPQESLGEEANRTAKGNVTQAAREKYATVGKDKFPIFDKKSAEAAIDLRGHAPEADRTKIINKAAKDAPKAAKKAREEDKKKNESRKISKSRLLDIVREEVENLREEVEDYEVKYYVPVRKGVHHVYNTFVKATDRQEAIAKVKDEVKEKHPRATGFTAVEGDLGFGHYD